MNENGIKSFTAGTTIAKYLRVRLSSGVLALAGASDQDCLGQCEVDAVSGDVAPVRLVSKEGTAFAVANGAVALTDTLYAAASGKVATTGTVVVGVPLSTCSANGEIVEFLPSPSGIVGNIARSGLTEDALQRYTIPLSRLRVWDAPATNAVGTPANDDLGIVYNTFLTAAPTVETGDLKNAGSTSRKVGFQFALPAEYVDGQDLKVRINCGMKTTVASTAATIDVQVTRTAAPTVDICATAAQDMNSLTAANKDFVLTATNCVKGDLLDIVITALVNDTATGTAVIGQINSIEILADIKG